MFLILSSYNMKFHLVHLLLNKDFRYSWFNFPFIFYLLSKLFRFKPLTSTFVSYYTITINFFFKLFTFNYSP